MQREDRIDGSNPDVAARRLEYRGISDSLLPSKSRKKVGRSSPDDPIIAVPTGTLS
jgi:hypothetical protein